MTGSRPTRDVSPTSSGEVRRSTRSGEVRRSTRSGAVGLIGAAINGACGFVLTMVIVRTFGAAGSGALFSAIALVTILGALCCLGADTALLWAIPRRRLGPAGDAARLVPLAVLPTAGLGICVAVVGWLAAAPITAALLGADTPDAVALVRLAFIGVPVVVVTTVLLAVVRTTRPVEAYVGLQFLLVPVTRPLLVGGSALLGGSVLLGGSALPGGSVLPGGGALLGFAGWLLPLFAVAVGAFALIAGPLGLTAGARLRPDAADWRTFWSFSLPRAGSAAIDASSMWVGVLLAGALAGQAEAGVFAAVGRYVLAGLLIMHGVRVATAPQLSRLLGEGRLADAVAVYRRTTGLIVLLSWPPYLVLAAFAPAFLQLFGPQFAAGAAPMAVLAVAMLGNVGVGLVQTVLLMSGNSRGHLLACVAGLGLNIAGCLLLVPDHGALGAAYAWALGILTENLIAAVLARRVLAQPLFTRAALRAVAAVVAGTALACVAGIAVAGRGLPGLGVASAVLVAVGIALLGNRRVRAALVDLRSRMRPATTTEEADL